MSLGGYEKLLCLRMCRLLQLYCNCASPHVKRWLLAYSRGQCSREKPFTDRPSKETVCFWLASAATLG